MEIKDVPYGYSIRRDDHIAILYKGDVVVERFTVATEWDDIVKFAEEHAAKEPK